MITQYFLEYFYGEEPQFDFVLLAICLSIIIFACYKWLIRLLVSLFFGFLIVYLLYRNETNEITKIVKEWLPYIKYLFNR